MRPRSNCCCSTARAWTFRIHAARCRFKLQPGKDRAAPTRAATTTRRTCNSDRSHRWICCSRPERISMTARRVDHPRFVAPSHGAGTTSLSSSLNAAQTSMRRTPRDRPCSIPSLERAADPRRRRKRPSLSWRSLAPNRERLWLPVQPQAPVGAAAEAEEASSFELAARLNRRDVFHPTLKPRKHFVECVLDGFSRRISVRFVRQHDQPRGAAVSRNCLVHPLGLNGKRSGVVIHLTVDEENRFL